MQHEIFQLLSTGIISRVSNPQCSVVVASKAALMTTIGSGITSLQKGLVTSTIFWSSQLHSFRVHDM